MTILTTLGVSFLAHLFSALLPPLQNEDEQQQQDYYAIMGLTKHASQEEIRKAYKKKSLTLHPDKVAQRGGDAVAAQVEYQKVQEAHAVLVDAKKRGTYNALGCSPSHYQFIATNAWYNPSALYQNLLAASCAAKSRIVFLLAILIGLVLLQPILIVVKVNQLLKEEGALETTDWVIVLIPIWVLHSMYLGLRFLIFLTDQNKFQSFISLWEQASWLVWEVLLAIRWDLFVDWKYTCVFIPLYIAIFLKFSKNVFVIRRVLIDVTRMITTQHLENDILTEGRTYEDLTEEERALLQQEFILVHVPPEHAAVEEAFLVGADEEDVEEARVHSSPEFQQAMELYQNAMEALRNAILFWPAQIVLIVLKVDDHISVSWWVVFIPLWVHLGRKILSSVWTICCTNIAGNEVLLGGVEIPSVDEEDDEDNKEKEEIINSSVDVSITSSTPTKGGTSGVDIGGEPTETATSSKPLEEQLKAINERTTDKDKSLENLKEEGSTEEEGINIGEETYGEWQSVYEEAESNAVEAQAKAMGSCCVVMLQLLIMCLIVGKLEQSDSYNAVWIIFPILVIAGMALCCCTCLIYGTGVAGEAVDEDMEQVVPTDERDDAEEFADEDIAAAEEGAGKEANSDPSAIGDGTNDDDNDLD